MRHQCRAADFDTESAETRAKPNRPVGRLMSAQASADPSKLGRCHLRRHQPFGFRLPRVTEICHEGRRTRMAPPHRVFLPKGEFPSIASKRDSGLGGVSEPSVSKIWLGDNGAYGWIYVHLDLSLKTVHLA